MIFYDQPNDDVANEIIHRMQSEAKSRLSDRKAMKILDGDFEEIQKNLFHGLNVSEVVNIHSESIFAIPQGSPFLSMAESIRKTFRRFSGVHSVG